MVCSGKKIELSISDFKDFIQGNYLYIDKSQFIEHVLTSNRIQLICRPRRMGKSLNLSMLKYFFDMDEQSEDLFADLYISKTSYWEALNQYPVIYLNFKELRRDDYIESFAAMVEEELSCYVKEHEFSSFTRNAMTSPYTLIRSLLKYTCKNIYDKYNKKPIILIDEYDKLIIDNADNEQIHEIKEFLRAVLSSALKDNPFIERAIITGVNRIAHESLFSDLNNIAIDDVFTSTIFDSDFGFTEEEVQTLYTRINPNQLNIPLDTLRCWYNNYLVGNSYVYFSYSLMSSLYYSRLNNYWGRSGVMDTIRKHINSGRFEQLTKVLNEYPQYGIEISIKDRLSIHDLKDLSDDDAFYSMLIQTGYLSYEMLSKPEELATKPQLVRIANLESKLVWEEFLLKNIYGGKIQDIKNMFKNYKDPTKMSMDLTTAFNNKLSYYDFEANEPEKTYHVFLAGILTALGYKWSSNRESGLGRYDLFADLHDFHAIFEFKKAEDMNKLDKGAEEAITQIFTRRYVEDYAESPNLYFIGVAFEGKMCGVRVQKYEMINTQTDL